MSTIKKTLLWLVAIAVVILVAIVGIDTAVKSQVSSQLQQAGDISENKTSFPQGISIQGVSQGWPGCTISLGQDQCFIRNVQSFPIIIDQAEGVTLGTSTQSTGYVGTASSTMLFSISTSTASTLNDYATPYGGLINNAKIATGTPNQIPYYSDVNGGTNAQGEAYVPVGGYVIATIQPGAVAPGGVCNPATTKCETATSTNRGYSVNVKLHWHGLPGSSQNF